MKKRKPKSTLKKEIGDLGKKLILDVLKDSAPLTEREIVAAIAKKHRILFL